MHDPAAVFPFLGNDVMQHFMKHHSFDHVARDKRAVQAGMDADEFLFAAVGAEADAAGSCRPFSLAPGDPAGGLPFEILFIEPVQDGLQVVVASFGQCVDCGASSHRPR